MEQQLVALARRQRGHTQQVQRLPSRSRRQRRRVRARLHDVDSLLTDAVASQGRGRATAGHDDTPGRRQRPPLAGLERGGGRRADAGLGRQRVMHERDDPQSRGFLFRFLRHRAESEAIGEHDRVVVDCREHATCVSQGLRRGKREAVVQLVDGDCPSTGREAGDNASIVAVAAREGVDAARDQQDE